MGTPLVIGIAIYLLLIIALTAWFLRIHLQKGSNDLEPNKSLPMAANHPNLENQGLFCEGKVSSNAPDSRLTESDSISEKK